jgi:hypothetical protein
VCLPYWLISNMFPVVEYQFLDDFIITNFSMLLLEFLFLYILCFTLHTSLQKRFTDTNTHVVFSFFLLSRVFFYFLDLYSHAFYFTYQINMRSLNQMVNSMEPLTRLN